MTDDRPTLTIEVSFVESPSDPDDWTDITAYLLLDTVEVERGHSDEFDPMQPAKVTFLLNNSDRRFDPDYASSPYYPYVRPNKRIRITALWDDDPYRQFTGFVLDWNGYRRGEMPVTQVLCTDALGTAFAQNEIPDATEVGTATVSGSAYVNILTGAVGETDVLNLLPMTRISLEVDEGGASAGTFRIRYGATWTSPIAYNATSATILAALDTLPGLGAGVVFGDNDAGTLATSAPIIYYIAGEFLGVDISADLEVDFSSVTPPDAYVAFITPPATTDVLPTFAGRPNAHDFRASIPASAATMGSPTSVWFAMNTGVNRAVETTSIDLYSGVLSAQNTFPFEYVFAIAIGTSAADAGRAVTVGVLTAIIPSGLSGEMFIAAARLAGWRNEEIDADAGDSTLQAIDPVGVTPISLFQTITESEGGVYYVSKTGLLTFRSRSGAVSGTAIATLTGAQVEDIRTSSGERYIRNSIVVNREGGDPQAVQDATSIRRYYLRTLTQDAALMETNAEALERAQFLRGRYAEPHTRITSVKPLGVKDPATLWPILLAAELIDVYGVDYAVLPGGVDVEYLVRLERATLTISATNWKLDWATSPGAGGSFILDVSELDGDDVLFY